jgi:N-acetylglutamate synthase-like GNAT family acetyltransferase
MNTKIRATFDVDSLREALDYSTRFVGSFFCIIIDAETFNNCNRTKIIQDILRITNSCKIKLAIIIGCFPVRERGSKRKSNLNHITSATEALTKQAGANFVLSKIRLSDNKLVLDTIPNLSDKPPVIIIPAIQYINDIPKTACDITTVISLVKDGPGAGQIAKLVILSSHDGILAHNREFIPQIHCSQVRELLDERVVTGELTVILEDALFAIDKLGIKRVHIVNGKKPDELLAELFTKDGSGTMIYSGEYIRARQASINDLNGVYELCRWNHNTSIGYLADNIGQFLIAVIDDYVIACARVRQFPNANITLIDYLATVSGYPETGLEVLKEALKNSNGTIYIAMFDTTPWWIPPEFKEITFSQLTQEEQKFFPGEMHFVKILKKQ